LFTFDHSVALSGKLQIMMSGLGGFFLEAMENINGFSEGGNIEYAPFAQDMNPYFLDSASDIAHWFPIRWLNSILYLPHFKTSATPSFQRKITQIILAESQKF